MQDVLNQEKPETKDQENFTHPFEPPKTPQKKTVPFWTVLVFAVMLGLTSGWYVSNSIRKPQTEHKTVEDVATKKGDVVGLPDKSTFQNEAEGILQRNDDGEYKEGSHVLLRDNNPILTVYLSSASVDLDLYVGKKVHVWGETHKGQEVAWLMDVGLLELAE
ncbi:MAG TPA: hypothetical protein VJ179_03905 [Patescibacteria group bacterium]|nr:hypothetical protein [Patescibacteria group bacterium]